MSSPIVAGAPLSLTGRFAVQGQQARRGLDLWATRVNDAGGLVVAPGEPRRPVRLTIYDDASRRAGAAEATARTIVDDRVDLLFSPYSSVLALAAAEVAAQHGRALWNHGGSSDAIDARSWRHVVSLLTPASQYFAPVLDYAVQRGQEASRPARSVALLHGASGTFPQAVIAGARSQAATLGLTVVLDETYLAEPLTPQPPLPCEGEGERLRDLVARLATLHPDAILGVGTTEADLAFARELRRQRVESSIIGLVAAPIEQFQEQLGADAEGFCGPSQWEPTHQDRPEFGPTSAQFCTDFRARFGVEPDYPAAQAYAAGLIASRCVEMARTLQDDALLHAARQLDTTTFYGRFRLDPGTMQQVGHAMVVAQWHGGKKRIVWPTHSKP